ncbi:PhoX family protein [Usitatibacter palustris]|uniref:Phosphatase n=1 Tax=Usitatibacter palustris TaxID=2732487 RepID=A0A6M4H3D0_9PROT|nr:PhoX family phosphatase [Usitatibacter palustris]QJR14036.1 hypothetical protein DSM104440_00828 [Usitatibacter palustris]
MTERASQPAAHRHDDDVFCNESDNPTFDSILGARLSRRGLLRGSAGLFAGSVLGPVLAACSDDDDPVAGFKWNAVAKSTADALTVPAGYSARVLYRLGDPIDAATPTSANNGTDTGTSFAARAGDHHDGMHYFGLGASGAYDATNSTRGLLVMNHENITQLLLHPAGATTPRPADQVIKEMNCHGVSVVEVTRTGSTWTYTRGGNYNRRITTNTEMILSGPAGGSNQLKTKFSTNGTRTRGTVNNCANGYTPWGTYLTCEENWAFYFKRAAGDNANRSAAEVTALNRNGITQGAAGNYGWTTVTPGDAADTNFARWDATKVGTSTDGTDDFRNGPNTFGWIVEIDPFNATSVPKKRTAMGRFAHEGCFVAPPVVGQPLVFYSGDDSRGEYCYKFVSTALWSAADATGGMAAGDKYLDAGKNFVCKFNADGTGSWIELTLGTNGITSASTVYPFADAADVLINLRLAADVAGATKMDRPEWSAINPKNGDVYFTMTNNSVRGSVAQPMDAANPRYYTDNRGTTVQRGNNNGHIVRLAPSGGNHAATTFTWDIYLFAAQATADTAANNADYQANVNLSGLDDTNDMSSVDGCWFSQATPGLLWIQTDDGAYTDVTNCMMLAALPGNVGDGGAVTVANKAVPQGAGGATVDVTVTTRMGKKPEPTQLRRFLVGPKGCEITGIAETPDGRTIFVNIQHPGENTTAAQLTAGTPESVWPDGSGARPRSATVAITRDDGGKIAVD